MYNEDIALGSNIIPDFNRCVMLLIAQISEILAATEKLTLIISLLIPPPKKKKKKKKA